MRTILDPHFTYVTNLRGLITELCPIYLYLNIHRRKDELKGVNFWKAEGDEI